MTETSLTSSWVNFTRGIASKATLQQYSHSVRRYMTFLKVKDPDDLLMLDKKSTEDSLMEFIQWQKDGGVGAGLIRVRMAATATTNTAAMGGEQHTGESIARTTPPPPPTPLFNLHQYFQPVFDELDNLNKMLDSFIEEEKKSSRKKIIRGT